MLILREYDQTQEEIQQQFLFKLKSEFRVCAVFATSPYIQEDQEPGLTSLAPAGNQGKDGVLVIYCCITNYPILSSLK